MYIRQSVHRTIIGRLSADSEPQDDRLSNDTRPVIGWCPGEVVGGLSRHRNMDRLSIKCRLTINGLLFDRHPTVTRPLADHRPIYRPTIDWWIDRLSTDISTNISKDDPRWVTTPAKVMILTDRQLASRVLCFYVNRMARRCAWRKFSLERAYTACSLYWTFLR